MPNGELPEGFNNRKKNTHFQVNLSVSNEVKLNPIEPIPINFNGNSFRYVKNRRYIPFLDSNDNLANILLEARLISSTQNACISSIAQSLIGKGLKVNNTEEAQQDPEWREWLKNVNTSGKSFNDVLVAIADGERTQGNQFVEVQRGEFNGKRWMKINVHSMLNCRLETPEKEEFLAPPTHVIVSRQLSKNGYTPLPKDALSIPLWKDNTLQPKQDWLKGAKGGERTMLHFKNDINGVEYYGLPASIAAIRYQVLEAKAAQFNIDNFDNNMVLGGLLIFKSGMTREEAEENAKEILLSHIGDGKTGRIAVIASETGLKDVEFIPYSTQKEGSYLEFDKRVEEKIISANQWDSVLAGINRSSTFGNGSQYIRSIWDVKDAVLLNPLRTTLIESIIKPIMKMYSIWFSKPDILKYEYGLQTNMPFSFMADLDPNKFFQINEARLKAGLFKDDSKDGIYLSEVGGKLASNNRNQNVPSADESK